MPKYTYEQLKDEYTQLWNTMRIIRDAQSLDNMAKKVAANKAVYMKVQQATGVPWQLVAVIHIREAGLSDVGQWKGVLHNGEKIVGTGARTRLVPAQRGPFSDWHSAAVDALKLKGFDKIKSWPVSRMLWALEPYNGYGYRNKGLRSPYLWASTNHQQRGKYVADGVFDPNAIDSQMGSAAMLKFLGVGSGITGAPELPIAAATGILAWLNPEYIIPILIVGAVLITAFIIYRKKHK